MNNKTYDLIKDVSLLWMPILITFYGVVSDFPMENRF